jgi:photosystem II stability/assembly factor-like uncharacterized protein
MRRLILLLILSTTVPAGQAPRLDAWRVIGPGGAGGMFLPTISPHDESTVLEHCDMTGAYISLDAGLSWRMFNLRGVASAFAFDPKDRNVTYAGNHALWRSADTGKTWSMVLPDPALGTVEHMRDDHAAPMLTTGDGAYPSGERVRTLFIAVDPEDSKRVYALLEHGQHGQRLVFSADSGRKWSRVPTFSNAAVRHMYFDGGLRLVTGSGVFDVHGDRWNYAAGLPGVNFRAASGGRGLLYATSDKGIHVSRDGGATWQTPDNPLPGKPRFRAIACSAYHPESAYVAFEQMDIPGAPKTGLFGIAKTSDGGRHWSEVFREGDRTAPNLERSWVEDFYRETGPMRDLGVSPTNPDICYVTDSVPRSFRTLDGGKSWRQVITEHVGKDRWTTTGFDVTNCYGLHFDPFDPKALYLSQTDVGLFKSEDGGATWKSSISGIPSHWENTTYWVALDPKVKGLLWGAFAYTHDLPRPKMWRRTNPDVFQGGTATSTDGGAHWTVTNQGMPETAVTHILMDPGSPVGARTLYACGFGKGVYKSTDNGKSWVLKIQGIEKRQPFAWRITRASDGTLYLVVARRSEGGYTGDAEDGALYKSSDGAEHWVKMKLPEGVNGPNGLTLDPSNNRRMYLSAWGVQLPDGVRNGGVYLSTDGGIKWKNVFHDMQHVYDVTVDPRDPRLVYLCGFENGAYRSADGGVSWARIRGFNFKWGHRVVPDPADRSMIYITTFGGGLWHGPAAGDPRSLEDAVTPVPVEP